jgi:hypothetical protein
VGECIGCFPYDLGYGKNDGSQKGEKMMEQIGLSCDRYDRK